MQGVSLEKFGRTEPRLPAARRDPAGAGIHPQLP